MQQSLEEIRQQIDNDDATTIAALRQLVEAFVSERQWHSFHSPKNLSMALAIEASELMEHFQWIDVEESRQLAADPEASEKVGEELADVLCYALALANAMKLDISETMAKKMAKNVQKYPAAANRQAIE